MGPAAGVRADRIGVQPAGVQTLVVNSDALAKIFSGAITMWNDPILAALNPGVALPTRQDHADLPGGLVGNHRQLAEVSDGRRTAELDKGCRHGVSGRCRRRCAEDRPASSRRCRPRRAPSDTSRRASLIRPALPFAQIDTGKGGVAAHQRHGPQRRQRSSTSWPAATTWCWTSMRCTAPRSPSCLPIGPGHLRDRVLDGLRPGHRRGDQVVPYAATVQRSDRPLVGRLCSACPIKSRSDWSPRSTQCSNCLTRRNGLDRTAPNVTGSPVTTPNPTDAGSGAVVAAPFPEPPVVPMNPWGQHQAAAGGPDIPQAVGGLRVC